MYHFFYAQLKINSALHSNIVVQKEGKNLANFCQEYSPIQCDNERLLFWKNK